MVRNGETGRIIADFERRSVVALGWSAVGDLDQFESIDAIRDAVARAYSDAKAGNVMISGCSLRRFRSTCSKGDRVVTYHPPAREFLLGTVGGDYAYGPGPIPE
jgi:restriction system protein